VRPLRPAGAPGVVVCSQHSFCAVHGYFVRRSCLGGKRAAAWLCQAPGQQSVTRCPIQLLACSAFCRCGLSVTACLVQASP